LTRKADCAVLVSTHHLDDVEIIADRVWFLNERYLAFNGAMSSLREMASLDIEQLSERFSRSSARSAFLYLYEIRNSLLLISR
jgi:ABC-type multidrug transport system ATPase subunit